jgi:hypothetical protein
LDELNPGDPRYKRYLMARRLRLVSKQRRLRSRRAAADPEKKAGSSDGIKSELKKAKKPKQQIVVRTWHNWVGRYRNSLTGIARAGESCLEGKECQKENSPNSQMFSQRGINALPLRMSGPGSVPP